MGQFDIEYATRTPQGGAAGVRANLDVSTGAEAIGGAIQRLGGVLLDIDIANQKSQQAMELSTFQRKDEEVKASALQTLLSPDFDINDEDAIVKLKEKTDTDRTGQTSKSGRVNFLYSIHLDKTSPNWDKKFFDEIRGIKAGNAKDDFKLNSESFLAKGDLVNYQQLVNRAFETGVITRTEQKYRTENALIDSVFAQSRDMIGNGNYLEAIAQLEALEGLSPTQLEYRDKISKRAAKAMKQNSDAAISAVVIKKENLRDKPLTEREAAAAEMKQELVDGGVVGDDLNKWFGILDKWTEGDKDPTEEYDPPVAAAVRAQVTLNPEGIEDGQIWALVGLGKKGGISATQAQAFVKLRHENIDKKPSMQKELHGRKQDILKGMYNADLFGDAAEVESALKYNEMADKLTLYSHANKEFSAAEMDEFFAGLIGEQAETQYLELAKTFFKNVTVWGLPANIRRAGREYEMRVNARNAKRLAQSEPITRRIGDTEVIGGSTWKFVKKGETPNKDVWEKVE